MKKITLEVGDFIVATFENFFKRPVALSIFEDKENYYLINLDESTIVDKFDSLQEIQEILENKAKALDILKQKDFEGILKESILEKAKKIYLENNE